MQSLSAPTIMKTQTHSDYWDGKLLEELKVTYCGHDVVVGSMVLEDLDSRRCLLQHADGNITTILQVGAHIWANPNSNQ